MRKKSLLLLEVVIWFLLLGGLVCIGAGIINHNIKSRQYYHIVFKDVDGVMVGSPVRLMGIQVGYVTEVKPVSDEVNVAFAVTNSDVIIPKGSSVNIQFTGLAGSKSLEIIPSKSGTKTEKFFTVSQPVRINSLMEVQKTISESIISCASNLLHFMGTQSPETLRNTIKISTKTTKEHISNVDNISELLQESNQHILTSSKDYVKLLSSKNKDLLQVQESFKANYSGENSGDHERG